MNNFLTNQYVDHFMQAQIIHALAGSEEPLRFSQLKEDGVDNSLFMYHANKLLDRGMIEKKKGGFKLTVKGAAWVNYASPNLLAREPLPKPLVQSIVKAKDQVLIAKRIGSMRELINEYLLPGTTHRFNLSAEDCMNLFLQDLFTAPTGKPKLISVVETIVERSDIFVHHAISSIFRLELPEQLDTNCIDNYKYEWMDATTITKSNPLFKNSQIVPTLVNNAVHLNHYELIRF